MKWPIRLIGPYLRLDPYGIYFWTRRFLVNVKLPLRFWELNYQQGPAKYHGGNVHVGPSYIAWYDKEATR